MPLERYKKKRDFDSTPEPEGRVTVTDQQRFVIQEHHATRLHFDLRLEMDGVLKSWAIPKGPSLDPAEKRLAVMTEDHPLEYLTFRGHIEEGNYGAGDMEIWDSGVYDLCEPDDAVKGAENGKLVVRLHGDRIQGEFHMVRMKRGDGNQWLIIKGKDEFVDPDWKLEQVLEGGSRKDRERLLAERGEPNPMLDETPSRSAKRDLSALAGVVESDMPTDAAPMLATLVDEPFSDPDWLFELKWDGYRAIVYIDGDNISFVSRNQKDLTHRFPALEVMRKNVKAERAILDGEIVALDENGVPSFQALQNNTAFTRWGQRRKTQPAREAELVFYSFDLLYLDGFDLRGASLLERKRLLREVIEVDDTLRYSDHIHEKGLDLFDQADKTGLEGIMAKKADSPYTGARSRCWLKMKTIKRQEFVIGGYTEPRKTRSHFGALIIGTYKDGMLVHAGQVGGGFDEKSLEMVHARLSKIETSTSPFDPAPKTNEKAHWVKPELVCEVKFREWTDDGQLRQPVFVGLREDKPPAEIGVERELDTHEQVKEASVPEPKRSKRSPRSAVDAAELLSHSGLKGDHDVLVGKQVVRLTNLQKIYWPEDGFTKADMLRYYLEMSEVILPHLKDRPLILRRYPDGIEGPSFYQHNLDEAPEWVSRWELADEDKKVCYGLAQNAADLLYIVNLGTIAQNPWLSRTRSPGRPDFLVLDLDPNEADFGTVRECALVVREIVEQIGLAVYPKTSGSRGIHLYIPLKSGYDYAQTYSFGEVIAAIAARRRPDIATDERMIRKRGKGRVYVDYMQNAVGKSVASPYSIRACSLATVSAPVTWNEIESGIGLKDFHIKNMRERVDRLDDLFSGVLTQGQSLSQALRKLDELLRAAPDTLDKDAAKRHKKAVA